MTHDEKLELINSRAWYQRFEILPGVFTNGKINVNAERFLEHCGIPEDLTGLRCLDIGTWEGPYAFELERRGASVMGIDVQDPDGNGFNTAKKIRESEVEFRQMDIYDLDPATVGTFDIVLFFGVFYHLKHPVVGFERVYNVLKPGGTMAFEGAILDNADVIDPTFGPIVKNLKKVMDQPLMYYIADSYRNDPTNWNLPTRTCLEDWVRSCGFEQIVCKKIKEASRGYGSAKRAEAGMGPEYTLWSKEPAENE